ncbi:MAG: GAF domain-containing sensor histidine kinase [Chloroflexota bacterium]|nr:GAF domain-containing sensor histidine kinase [Chloroflexota bacterium]
MLRDIDKTKKQLVAELEEMRQRIDRLLALQQASPSIQSTLDLKKVLRQVAKAVVVDLEYDHSYILLVDEKKNVLQGTAFFTREGNQLQEKVARVEEATSQKITQMKFAARDYSRMMSNALDGRATITHDLYEIASPPLTREQCRAVQEIIGAKTMVGIPLFVRDRYAGSILAFTTQENVTPQDIEPLWFLSNQAKIAIFNAYLYQAEKKMREDMGFYLKLVNKAQEEERKRIARDLHDDTTYELVSLSRRLHRLMSVKDESPERIGPLLNEAQQDIDRILEGIRRFCQELRPSILDDLGLIPALEWLASEFTSQSGIDIAVTMSGTHRRFNPDAELAMFRIAQEALWNSCRHSGASKAWVSIEYYNGKVIMRAGDDGKGFDMPENLTDLAGSGKLGLTGVKERIQLLEGALSLQSEPGKGTTLSIEVPI